MPEIYELPSVIAAAPIDVEDVTYSSNIATITAPIATTLSIAILPLTFPHSRCLSLTCTNLQPRARDPVGRFKPRVMVTLGGYGQTE